MVHRGTASGTAQPVRADYATLLNAAHQQLKAPIILVWDNLNTYVSKRMREFLDTHTDWLTVIRLPAYAAELKRRRKLWSHLKRGLGNCAVTNIDELVDLVKTRLKRLQYRPDLLNGFLGRPTSPSNPDNHDRHRPQPFNLCSSRAANHPDTGVVVEMV